MRKALAVCLGLALLALPMVADAGGYGWEGKTITFKNNWGSAAVLDSTRAHSAGKTTTTLAKQDTTAWFDVRQFSFPAPGGAVTDSLLSPVLNFQFMFGGSTADTNLVTIQACEDPSSTIATLHVLTIVGQELAWAMSSGVALNYSRQYWRAIFAHDDVSSSAYTTTATVWAMVAQ